MAGEWQAPGRGSKRTLDPAHRPDSGDHRLRLLRQGCDAGISMTHGEAKGEGEFPFSRNRRTTN